VIPIEDEKWYALEDYGGKTRMPPGHRIEYARVDNGIVVRIVGPNAHVWGASSGGQEALNEAIDKALNWFSSVGGEL
jgi:hypothetical protein